MFSKMIKLSKKSAEFCVRVKQEYDKEFGAKGSLEKRLLNLYKIEADQLKRKLKRKKDRINNYKILLKIKF